MLQQHYRHRIKPTIGGAHIVDIDSLVDDMRPPTEDDVPMTSDWQPLDTKDKLLAYLDRFDPERILVG